jgi:purine-nucleoside phosphorylase
MPRVPTYDGPQIGQTQMPSGTLQVQAADMSGIGRALTGLGKDVQDIYRAERNRAVEASLNQAYATTQNAETEIFYGYQKKGPDDPRESTVGVMQMEGGDLMARAGEFRQKYQRTLNEVENQLTTPEAKTQYQRSKLTFLSSFDRQLQQRIGTQRERTVQTSYQQFQDSLINNLASGSELNFDGVFPRLADGTRDMTAFNDAMETARISASQRALDPLSPMPDATRADAARRLTLEAQSKILQSTLPILMSKDPQLAKQVAEKYVDSIPDKNRVFEHLENLNFNEQAQKNANLAVALAGGGDVVLGQSFGTLAEQEQRAIEFVRKNELSKDQKTNDESLRRIKLMFDERKTLQRQKDAELSDQITSEILAGKIQTQDALRADPRFPSLDGSTQARLLKVYEKDGNIERPEVMQAIQRMAFSDDPKIRDAFKKIDATKKNLLLVYPDYRNESTDTFEVADGLTQREFKYLSGLREDLIKSDAGALEKSKYNDKKTIHQLAREKVEQGLIRKRDETEYFKSLENTFEANEVKLKRPLTAKERNEIADDLVKKILTDQRSWYGTRKEVPAFKLPTEERFKNSLIPLKK